MQAGNQLPFVIHSRWKNKMIWKIVWKNMENKIISLKKKLSLLNKSFVYYLVISIVYHVSSQDLIGLETLIIPVISCSQCPEDYFLIFTHFDEPHFL